MTCRIGDDLDGIAIKDRRSTPIPPMCMELLIWTYRRALRLRRQLFGHAEPRVEWMDMGPGILAFHRESGFRCVFNMDGSNHVLPADSQVALSSDSTMPHDDERIIRPDAAVWLRT